MSSTDGVFKHYPHFAEGVEAVQFTSEYKDRIYHQIGWNKSAEWECGIPILCIYENKKYGRKFTCRIGDWIFRNTIQNLYWLMNSITFQYLLPEENGNIVTSVQWYPNWHGTRLHASLYGAVQNSPREAHKALCSGHVYVFDGARLSVSVQRKLAANKVSKCKHCLRMLEDKYGPFNF